MEPEIRASVIKTLPTLQENDINIIMDGLLSLGVTTYDHLELVTENDLTTFVGLLIHRRLLIKEWTSQLEIRRIANQPAAPTASNEFVRNSSYPQPVINWDTIKSANLLDKPKLTLREEKVVLQEISDNIMKSLNITRNLPVESWLFVANQIGERNNHIHFKKYPNKGSKAQPYGRLTLSLHHRADYYCKQFALPAAGPANAEDASPARKRKGSKQVSTPVRLPPGEDETSIAAKESELQNMHKLHKDEWDAEKISNYMTLLFDRIKHLAQVIKPNVDEILNRFPFLLEMKYCIHHLSMLHGVNAEESFKHFIESRLDTVIKFLARKSSSVDRCAKIELDMDKACREVDTNVPRIVGALNMIAQHLEKKGYKGVFLRAESTATAEDIQTNLDLPEITPVIIALGSSEYTAQWFCIAAGGKVVGRTASITKAFAFYFATFYALHANYPSHLATFMEFFQRYVFDISDGEDVGVTDRLKTLKPGRKQAFTQTAANLISAIEDYHDELHQNQN